MGETRLAAQLNPKKRTGRFCVTNPKMKTQKIPPAGFFPSHPFRSDPFATDETLERVGGIEPPCSAWKADVLPLNYTRRPTATPPGLGRWCPPYQPARFQTAAACFTRPGPSRPARWWRGKDSNLRRLSRQIYSLLPLAAREPLRAKSQQGLTIGAKLVKSFRQPNQKQRNPGRSLPEW